MHSRSLAGLIPERPARLPTPPDRLTRGALINARAALLRIARNTTDPVAREQAITWYRLTAVPEATR